MTVADNIFQNNQQFAACSANNICFASLKQSIEISRNQSIRRSGSAASASLDKLAEAVAPDLFAKTRLISSVK